MPANVRVLSVYFYLLIWGILRLKASLHLPAMLLLVALVFVLVWGVDCGLFGAAMCFSTSVS